MLWKKLLLKDESALGSEDKQDAPLEGLDQPNFVEESESSGQFFQSTDDSGFAEMSAQCTN
jgi:hypothetical protein